MRWLTCRIPAVAGLSLLAWSLTAQPVSAQVDSREGIALQNQIYQLRQEIQQLRDQGGRGGAGGPTYTAPQPAYRQPAGGDIVTQLLTRVDSLEEQVRELRGQLDQTQHTQQQQSADLSKRMDDLSFQMGTQGGGPGPRAAFPRQYHRGPSTHRPSAPTLQDGSAQNTPAGPVRRTPELALQEGNAALGRRDYAGAEAAAREVLNNYRTSPRTYDAQFLLAQALTGEKQYPQSAIAYDDAYNRNRKGARAQDALVGLASSLTALNEKKAACDTLVKLGSEFPQLKPEIRDQAAAVRQRAGCK